MDRILFITSNDEAPWGGSEQLWGGTAAKLAQDGVEVGICIKDWQPMPAQLAALKSLPNVRFFFKAPPSYLLHEKIYNKLLPSSYKQIAREYPYKLDIIAWKPRLVVLSQGTNTDGLKYMLWLKEHNLPYVTISQAVFEPMWPDDTKIEPVRAGFLGAARNYFVSQDNLRITELEIGERLHNAKVVRNPFNVPYNNEIPFPDTETYRLACVARYLFYAKGQDVLCQVMSDPKWKKRNIGISLYGAGRDELGIRRLIQYFDIADKVQVRGHGETADIWKQHHALVLASRFEGLPLALVEAMLCGRFGIVTNVSGNKEVLVDNVSGFLAEGPRPEYLDSALERAWSRRAEWEQIGLNAKNYIKTKVPPDPCAELAKEVIKVMNERP